MHVACPKCAAPADVPADGRRYCCPRCRAPLPPVAAGDLADFEFGAGPSATSRRSYRGGGSLTDFLTFRSMLTPVLIQVAFWAGVSVCWAVAFWLISSGLRKNEFGHTDDARVVAGAVLATIGPVVIRIVCELNIVIFKILDELRDANNRQTRG